MNEKNLWAPWRMPYIKSDKTIPPVERPLDWLPDADTTCFICKAVADTQDRENLVVARGPRTITILNRYPYNNGHLLIAPRHHRGRLDALEHDERADLMETISSMVKRLEQMMSPEGFNIGLNLGRVAGAGLPGHLHWHIVPRWFGDTSFMPVVASVDVIPQSLDALWELFATHSR